ALSPVSGLAGPRMAEVAPHPPRTARGIEWRMVAAPGAARYPSGATPAGMLPFALTADAHGRRDGRLDEFRRIHPGGTPRAAHHPSPAGQAGNGDPKRRAVHAAPRGCGLPGLPVMARRHPDRIRRRPGTGKRDVDW